VKPIAGPSALLLALMASGMNGQRFSFFGYLPIESTARNRALRNMEAQSKKEGITCLFIETPYRNNALFQAITENCTESTRICIAADLTGTGEFICTRTVGEWKKQQLDLHKRPVVFLMQGG
jgi:16S rRNA (cytidine1402-2'-O)-methyltransferase